MNIPERNIDGLRNQAGQGLLILLWLHLPILGGIAALLGHDWIVSELLAAGLAGAATGCWYFAAHSLETRMTVAVALVGMAALIVAQLSGNGWQVDSHMYFFAVLAMLAAYCDWRVLLMAAGAIAVHHLVLNFLLPAAIYPGGSDIGRVVLHAVIVVLETAVLVWMTQKLVILFDVSQAARDAAEEARTAQAWSHAGQLANQADADAAGLRARQDLALRFEVDVGSLVDSVAKSVADLHTNASGLSNTARLMVDTTACIVQASRDASSSVMTVATATEELSAGVSEISGQIARATGSAHQAVDQTRQTTETIERLAVTAGRIETVVQLINGIAGQTNLLALNATIEAARAGEAGKGFAVVATEVKALATQTAKATDDIRRQIEAIQAETGQAVRAMAGISQTIADLGTITEAVAAAVEQQGQTTGEIVRSARQAAAGAEAITSSLPALEQASRDTGSAADTGYAASGHVSQDCEKMTGSIRHFVGSLRAA